MSIKSDFLVSNDDGYKSYGIIILKNKSACSSALSVNKKIIVRKIDKNIYAVKGTSADCVNIATRGLMTKQPDYVISGINYGSNMGDDVIYSGTIGAAIEGRFCRKLSVAISISNRNPKYINDLYEKLKILLPKILELKITSDILNINIPDIPINKIKGIRFTKLGKRLISKRTRIFYSKEKILAEIGDVGKPKSYSRDTDFHAIKSGFISVTPITIDMTDEKIFLKMKKK